MSLARRTRAAALAAFVAIFAASPCVLRAEEEPTQPPPPEPEIRSAAIEEIIVTATKRETTLQDTAAAITVFGAEQLGFRELDDAKDLAFSVPGLVYGEASGSPQITIRGVGLAVETGAAEQGVASHVNGIFLSRPVLTNLALGDMERVEVLRGPQGTLYGRNSTGGAINYITKRPGDELDAELTAGFGSFDRRTVEGFVSGPLRDDLLLARVYAKFDDHDGYTENHSRFPGTEDIQAARNVGVRSTFSLLATDALGADLVYGYHRRTGSFTPFTWTNIVGVPFPTDPEIFTTEPNETYNNVVPNRQKHSAHFGSATIRYDWGNLTAKSITGLTFHIRDEHSDSDGRDPSPTLQAAGAEFDFVQIRYDEFTTWTEELNVSGRAWDRLGWIVGGFFMRETGAGTIDIFLGDTGNPATSNTEFVGPRKGEKTTSLALFTDLTFSVIDRLRVVAGARVGEDRKETALFDDTAAALVVGFPADGRCNPRRQKFSGVSPKGGVEYDLREGTLVYVQYQEATKPGGTNPNACVQQFKEEKVRSVEGGTRTSLFDDRLHINGTGFYYDYTNYQLFQILPPASAEIINAPKAHVVGGELEVFGLLGDFVRSDLGVSLLDAVYDEFRGIDTVNGPTAAEEDLSGNRLTRAPRYSIHGGVDAFYPLSFQWLAEARFRVEVRHTDDMFFRQFNRSFDKQDAYTVTNLFLGFTNEGDWLELRASVKNLFGTEYIVSQFSNVNDFSILPDSEGRRSALLGYWGQPRWLGVEMTARF